MNHKIGRGIAIGILCVCFVCEAFILWHFIDNFIWGFTPTDFVGNATGETVYGVQAIAEDGWAHLVYVPILAICVVYQVIYFVLRHRKGKGGNK